MRIFPYSISLLLGALALTGCAGVSYVSPTDGPVSKVRFVNKSHFPGRVGVYQFDDESCSIFKYTNMFLLLTGPSDFYTSPRRNLDMPLNTYNDYQAKEVFIPTNKPFLGGFTGEDGASPFPCSSHIYYPFKEGHEYEIAFERSMTRSCKTVLSEIVSDSKAPRLVQLKTYPGFIFSGNTDQEGCEGQAPK